MVKVSVPLCHRQRFLLLLHDGLLGLLQQLFLQDRQSLQTKLFDGLVNAIQIGEVCGQFITLFGGNTVVVFENEVDFRHGSTPEKKRLQSTSSRKSRQEGFYFS